MSEKLSVYTTLFNVENGMFNVQGALRNWSHYADQIVVATIKGQARKVCDAVTYREDVQFPAKVKVVEVDTSLDDPYFDGKLKNEALQNCDNDFVIQQDLDERIGGDKILWNQLSSELVRKPEFAAYMIPVIDLYKDTEHFKDIGRKWYLHRRKGCYRGPVAFAKRDDGTIDTDKSDTCELIDANGNLVPFLSEERFVSPPMFGTMFNDYAPHIIHLGYINLEKRVENNKFWEPVWSARNGKTVRVATSIEDIEQENHAISHGLGGKWWK